MNNAHEQVYIKFYVEDDNSRCSDTYEVIIDNADHFIDEDTDEKRIIAICKDLAKCKGHTWKYIDINILEFKIIEPDGKLIENARLNKALARARASEYKIGD